MKDSFQILDEIRRSVGKPHTSGLSRDILSRFSSDINLQTALEMASEVFNSLDEDQREILNKAEEVNLIELQEGFLNFYNTNSISPYVPLVAKGPWIVSAYGSVIYDTGGYGMLGQGHNPEFATRCLSRSQVMANIMTPSLSQPRFVAALRKEIGRNRVGGCPYGKFISMNSGSEAMSVASRISDLHAGKLISALEINERYTKVTKIVAMRGAFHGRTGRPARASSSSFKAYKKLASFRNYEGTLLVEPNNIEDLERTFTNAKEKNYHIEFIVLEPVMGEGNPGLAITPEFYAAARRLTKECGSLLIIDSIQSGLRTRGELSIVDYPGFETLDPPDMESYEGK
jgi:acetylornithine/succinyldiaminopimelate/putrescine aminotransferase